MTLSDLSIERPVLTWMMTLSILVFGVLGFARLGVDQYPRMDFAIVTVTTVLDGASPEVMEEDVTDVLEEFLNTIAGLRNLNSLTLHGISRIIVEFDLATDLDVAAQDVRDKVALARMRLPREIEAPIVEKADMSAFPIVWVPLITDRSVVETSEYARLRVRPQLQTIPGVGAVEMFGRLDSAGLVILGFGHRRDHLARKGVQFRGHIDMALVEKRSNC